MWPIWRRLSWDTDELELTARDLDHAAVEKFDGLRLHDLRHSFGSWKLDQGEDIVYVSKQLGHADVAITAKIYSHQIRPKRPEAAAKTDAMLFSATPAAARPKRRKS